MAKATTKMATARKVPRALERRERSMRNAESSGRVLVDTGLLARKK